MNLYLHGVEPHIYLGDTIYEPDRGDRYDVILTNPPFGAKGANQAPDRDDFTIETSNKQLNFAQHIAVALKRGGRAAIVLPDNCLFEDKAGEVFISEVKDRDYKLDITWLKDESLEDIDGLPEPQDLTAEAIVELEAVVDDLRDIISLIEMNEGAAVESP